jgi:Na+-transporting methylmalonyl-CoA/oxaloacetate decarboxylase gamma subunit
VVRRGLVQENSSSHEACFIYSVVIRGFGFRLLFPSLLVIFVALLTRLISFPQGRWSDANKESPSYAETNCAQLNARHWHVYPFQIGESFKDARSHLSSVQ